jgi:hypothetical protein
MSFYLGANITFAFHLWSQACEIIQSFKFIGIHFYQGWFISTAFLVKLTCKKMFTICLAVTHVCIYGRTGRYSEANGHTRIFRGVFDNAPSCEKPIPRVRNIEGNSVYVAPLKAAGNNTTSVAVCLKHFSFTTRGWLIHYENINRSSCVYPIPSKSNLKHFHPTQL